PRSVRLYASGIAELMPLRSTVAARKYAAARRYLADRLGVKSNRLYQPVKVDDDVSHSCVVNGSLRSTAPSAFRRSVVRKDAHEVDGFQVLEFERLRIVDPPTKHKMQFAHWKIILIQVVAGCRSARTREIAGRQLPQFVPALSAAPTASTVVSDRPAIASTI